MYDDNKGIITFGADKTYGGLYAKNLAIITANNLGTENGNSQNYVLLIKDAKYYTSTETQKEK